MSSSTNCTDLDWMQIDSETKQPLTIPLHVSPRVYNSWHYYITIFQIQIYAESETK